MANDEPTSSYLDHLPAIFHDATEGRFLLAFERILTGMGDPLRPGLEEVLDGIAGPDGTELLLRGVERYFDPGPGCDEAHRAPTEFLEYLASWVALTMREDWTDEEKRRILAGTVASYRKRGTRDALREVLAAYTGQPHESVEILELATPFIVGEATIATDTVLGEGPPHYFRVRMRITVTDPGDLARRERIARAIIDQEKPAHTYYDLEFDVRTLQIAVRSTVGVDTALGTVT